jgi:short-subunit dehydrogenase
MKEPALIITGIAPFSLGEAIVEVYSKRFPSRIIVGIDIIHNKRFENLPFFHEIIFDLNPLDYIDGLEGYIRDLQSKLSETLTKTGAVGVSDLIQTAGVYDPGRFIDNDTASRKRLLGVNTLSRVELLHIILTLNASFKIDSAQTLTLVDIGAAHGINATSGRSLYAASKAFMLDLCAALQKGGEIYRCIHFAPGPIDTHMLHRTHWVYRADGNPDFFDQIYLKRSEQYKSVFVDCDPISIREEAVAYSLEALKLLEAFEKYCKHRAFAFQTQDGILDPHSCARALVEIMSQPTRYEPGIYLATSPASAGLHVRMLPFLDLIRRRLFEAKAKVCEFPN